MDRTDDASDPGIIAASYLGEINKLIEKNSDWWISVDDKMDEQFGASIQASLEAAERLVKSQTMNEEVLQQRSSSFNAKLGEALRASKILVEYYSKNKSKTDVSIVTLFQQIVERHLNQLLKDRETGFSDVKKVNVERPDSDKARRKKSEEKKQFWLLRINGNNWRVSELKTGDILYFHSQRPGIGPADDYDLFKKVRPEDEGLAYQYGQGRAIIFVFHITKGMHDDPHEGEIISFNIVQILITPIPLAFLTNKISFVQSLEGSASNKLFSLTEDQFRSILSDTPVPPKTRMQPYFTDAAIADIFTDVSSGNLKDQLGFESDYIALASVVAYKNFQPPLAIGLFGNWGSGKSFFMNKLQGQIQKFADSSDDKFCHKIVQINFNSWHYSDSNLWASLITKIFEDIEKSGTEEGDGDKLKTLFTNLNSSQELKEESEQHLAKVQNELKQLEDQRKAIEQEILNKTEDLKGMNFFDVAKDIFGSADVKADIARLKTEFDFIKTDDPKQITVSLNELETTGGKLAESIKILYSLRKGNLWLALAIATVVFLGSSYLIANVGFIKEVFGDMKLIIAPFMVFISQAILYVKRVVPDINLLHQRLVSFKNKTAEMELKGRTKFNVEREEIQNKITSAQSRQSILQDKIKELEVKKVEAQYEIDNIASGKKLVGFIEGRVSDQRYANSLGIISWIRKDFEQLDFLLKQQYDAQKLKELNKQAIDNVFKVERIILYIDDLDRCDVSVVVRVLEAIHLLLAFPLFVVVVGVDPRWMHNALHLKYKGFISKEPSNRHDPGLKDGANVNNTVDGEELLVHGEPATSFDYLEKIFQIPFVLKPIDKKGKRKLIEANLKRDYYEETNNTKGNDDNTPDKDKNVKLKSQEKKDTGHPDNNNDDKVTVKTDTSIKDQFPEDKPLSNEQANRQAMKASADLLEVPENEIKFMQAIGFMVGESPRTIKRYINIYRIIRAHTGFAFVDDNKPQHYYAAMIILGIITSFPERAKEFFNYLKLEDDITPFWMSYQNYIEKKASDNPFPISLINESDNQELLKIVRSISMEKFKINLDMISRFSFRNIMDN